MSRRPTAWRRPMPNKFQRRAKRTAAAQPRKPAKPASAEWLIRVKALAFDPTAPLSTRKAALAAFEKRAAVSPKAMGYLRKKQAVNRAPPARAHLYDAIPEEAWQRKGGPDL